MWLLRLLLARTWWLHNYQLQWRDTSSTWGTTSWEKGSLSWKDNAGWIDILYGCIARPGFLLVWLYQNNKEYTPLSMCNGGTPRQHEEQPFEREGAWVGKIMLDILTFCVVARPGLMGYLIICLDCKRNLSFWQLILMPFNLKTRYFRAEKRCIYQE